MNKKTDVNKEFILSDKFYNDACNLVKKELDKKISDVSDCFWMNKNYREVAYDNLNFMYKNKIFSVIIEPKNSRGISLLTDKIKERQLRAAEQFNFIPCKFPITLTNYNKIKIKKNGWNLYHTETDEVIIPEKTEINEKEEASSWELRQIAISYVSGYLKSKSCRINFCQDVVEINPQIWFTEPNGSISWLIVRFDCVNADDSISDEKISEEIRKGRQNNGYMATISIKSKNGEKVYRGEAISAKLLQLKQIHKASDYKPREDDVLDENMKNLIKYSTSKQSVYENSKTAIFEIYNNLNLLLKINKNKLDDIDNLPENLVAVPIKYDKKIKENKNLGLPLYHICKKNSVFVKRGFAEPSKVIFMDSRNTSIIRRISGNNVAYMYRHNFLKLYFDFQDQLNNIIEIKSNYGNDVVKKILDLFKNSVSKVKSGQFGVKLPKYHFTEVKNFYDTYETFRVGYIGTLNLLSNLPQGSYDNAVNTVLSVNDFAFDFTHPNNTFIDYAKNEFNFLDFIFEKKFIHKYKSGNIVKQFRDTLFGVNIYLDIQPCDLLFNQGDIELYEKCLNKINEKINHVLPDELKIS